MVINRNVILTILKFCLLSLLLTESSNAQTITVTDQYSHKSPIRWTQFSTSLEATADSSPTPKKECKITSGPVWDWNLISANPAQPGFFLQPAGSTCTLLSNAPQPPEGGCFVKGGGQYTIEVEATATWEDDHNHSYYATGFVDVVFFVRVPEKVVELSHDAPIVDDPPQYGYHETFNLEIQDNSADNPDDTHGTSPYEFGTAREEFVTGTFHTNPVYSEDIGTEQNALGSPDEDPFGPEADFPDNFDDNTDDWNTTPLYTSTSHTGDTFWYGFDQRWHCMETAPGYPNYTYDTTLNTHIISIHQNYAIRQY